MVKRKTSPLMSKIVLFVLNRIFFSNFCVLRMLQFCFIRDIKGNFLVNVPLFKAMSHLFPACSVVRWLASRLNGPPASPGGPLRTSFARRRRAFKTSLRNFEIMAKLFKNKLIFCYVLNFLVFILS